jgi:kinesin family protein 11
MTKTFTFDKVFGPTSTQAEVYDEVAAPALLEVMNGYDCTIFAYVPLGMHRNPSFAVPFGARFVFVG